MPFKSENTRIDGLVLIVPEIFPDERGFFMETFKMSDFGKLGIKEDFFQDNHSCSSRGVLRGLHFQREPMAQGKLVRVVSGSVWDVAVDLREDSGTYGQWEGFELSEENHKILYIPPGFAHGFLTLRDNTHFLYKCTEEYSPENDGGVRWNDPDIDIRWPIESIEVAVSDKDKGLPFLKEIK